MASSNNYENVFQCKTCRVGEGDTNPDKQTNKCPNCEVFKSGPLLISSKGIGWTSWKKRWFILTRTSLVFYRVDPATLSQKGNETNATLGGIDLNSSGSVVVKADKKLLTVLFPDGRDGRTFSLKADTSEELYEWKAALENALAQAPSAALAMGQNGIFQNDMTEPVEASDDQCTEREPAQTTGVGTGKEKSTVIGRPILLALEDIDGNPSFLEKAFVFIEQHGVKVEGILRQSADVEEVKRRLRDYEQGKDEFSSGEDAHVIGDCIKYVLRELPSSPVPATCCTALVEAYRTDRGKRVDAIRSAIYDTFPEPNLRLMQRILKMMQKLAAHKSQNLMSLSALAACMAPLLLRPLLAGDCEFEDDFNMAGDGSIQLMKAAAAANHAQVIVIILLEEFDKIFDEDLLDSGSELYTDSEYDEVDDDDGEDDDLTDDDNPEDGDHDENSNDESTENDIPEDDASCKDHNSCDGLSPEDDGHHDPHNRAEADIDDSEEAGNESLIDNQKSEGASLQEGDETLQNDNNNEAVTGSKKRTVWGRAHARKNLSMESIDLPDDEKIAIPKLESMISDLKIKIAKEEKGNAMLQESLKKRKEALYERRLALEQEVEKLQGQLKTERELRHMQPRDASFPSAMDSKKVVDLHGHQPKQSYSSLCESCGKHLHSIHRSAGKDQVENASSTGLADQRGNLLKQAGSSELHKTQSQESIAANRKNVEAQSRESVSASDGQPSQRTNTANQSSVVSRGFGKVSSIKESAKVGGIAVSRQPLTSEDLKKDAQDPSQPKQSPVMQWPSSTALNILKGSNGVSSPDGGAARRVSPRAEDSLSSSSSALAKLTNRLNFLKERRAQLASGQPAASNTRTSGPDGSPTSNPPANQS